MKQFRSRGADIYWGNATQPEFLARCGIANARALIVTIGAVEGSEGIGRPPPGSSTRYLTIVARARDASHARELYELGVTDAVPETVEASLQLSEAALVDMGVPMGLVIASIHDKRDEYRKALAAGRRDENARVPCAAPSMMFHLQPDERDVSQCILKARRRVLSQAFANSPRIMTFVLCDVWGVVHNGIIQYEKATDALRRFREKGGSVILITNAPRARARVQSFLDNLHVPRDAYDGIVTSGDVTTSAHSRTRRASRWRISGPPEDMSLFDEAQSALSDPLRFVDVDAATYAVCIGQEHAERETPEDYDARLRTLRARNAEFVCANPDIVVEMGDKLVYCAGALAERYEALGGRVVQAGKPHAEIYRRAIALAAEVRRCSIGPARVLAIGDSAHTDIKGGEAQGFDTLFITSGIHRAELHAETGAGPLIAAALHQFLDHLDFAPTGTATELLW